MPISVVFDPPLPSDSPSTFNTKAFTLLGDLNDWSTQANALPGEVATNLTTLLAAPPAIGSTTPAAGNFTTLSASGAVTIPETLAVGSANTSYRLSASGTTGDHKLFLRRSNNNANGFALWTDASGVLNAEYRSDSDVAISGPLFSVAYSGAVTIPGSLSLTGGTFGYGVGAGGTVTQATSKGTGVTLNKPCGVITTSNSSMTSGAWERFDVTNSNVSATDLVLLTMITGGGNKYRYQVDGVGTGSFAILITNISAGTLSETLVFNFSVVKGATS